MKKAALGVLVLLAVLAVLVDRVAEQVAERVLATQAERELGVRPSLEIGGFPFLTQALAGRYRGVTVSAKGVQRGAVRLDTFSSTLRGVRVPLSEALGGSVGSVRVDRLTATGRVPYSSLEAAAGVAGLQIGPDPAGVRVSRTVRVLGQDVAATAVEAVQLDGDTVVLTAQRIEVAGVPASGRLASALAGRLDVRVRLPALPYGVTLTALVPGPAGLTVSGGTTDTVLRR